MRTRKGALYWGVRILFWILALVGLIYGFWYLPTRPESVSIEFVP
ncbi:MAG: hypothetical protein N2045_06465 [Fimbriimonadales bacterium]|jgi:hypothetical protein|nr:hypothetical protein [Fimbriimonadales bacterium]CUU01218.1 hypothetical protein GBSOP10_100623 [Armatimonadetes bacterium GBS]CUU34423.1 hypothetical protein GXSOP10_11623 [Armatimonadetes bacterium GXS]CUU35673.1 hypothetical protein DCOP10_11558 [Armatimonadetes bacterium DC]GBC89367.1 hypothetical protein HRbin14_00089 [bacterium HR14]